MTSKGTLTRTFVVALSNCCLNPVPHLIRMGQEAGPPESSRYAAPPGPRRTRVTSALRAEVVHRYARGKSSAVVAESCGIAKSTVLKILRAEGTKVRPWGKRH
jgi:hypothetical protein